MPTSKADDPFRTTAHVPGTATEPVGTEPERAPILVPGYEILGILGRGGMGVVYKARHLALKRTVALKMILSGGHAGPRELTRFRIEAEAVARLQHPNIVQIHEVGDSGGHPYCALEFVEGGNLAGKINGKPMPAREAARLLEVLARAMQLAHSRNVVHRDLKPANILLAGPGMPKITDFGLARQTDSDSGETQAGAVMGTPSYMAPEQASERAHEAGPAADIYALGAILYECLTGRPPFKGKTVVETLDQVRTQEPEPPSRGQQSVPLDLETICLKCLRKEPERRYASAAELADDLVRYQQGEPILARPVGRSERAVKWVKRNPVVAVATIIVMLALAVTTIVSYLKYLDAEEQKGIARSRQQDEQEQMRIAEDRQKDAEQARDFLVSIFRISETDALGGNVTARQILAQAEKRIPVEFAGQPELRAELVAAIGKVKRDIARKAPQAMILEVRPVQLQSAAGVHKPAVPQALVNLDDRLTVSADGQIELVFLSDFHKERIQPGRMVTIDTQGCEPADAVQERDSSILMTFAPLPKATFYMGWDGRDPPPPLILVQPKRKGVKTEIKEDFEIATHDVTQGQWQAIMGNNPSHFSRTGNGRNAVLDLSDEELKLFPVENVSWDDAQQFIKKLNEKERGRGYWYRLPTDAEWEYACRGGATSEAECSFHFYFDKPSNELSSEQANFDGNFPFGKASKGPYLQRTTRVGAYPPNRLGLCDMHGNVNQWCADSHFNPVRPDLDKTRVYRGNSFRDHGDNCIVSSSNAQSTDAPSRPTESRGFRLVRVRGGSR